MPIVEVDSWQRYSQERNAQDKELRRLPTADSNRWQVARRRDANQSRGDYRRQTTVVEHHGRVGGLSVVSCQLSVSISPANRNWQANRIGLLRFDESCFGSIYRIGFRQSTEHLKIFDWIHGRAKDFKARILEHVGIVVRKRKLASL